MKEKVSYRKDAKEKVYDDTHWKMLRDMRIRASGIMEKLPVDSYVHGSLARGDVKKSSDIDIIILEVLPSYKIEYSLNDAGLGYQNREIVVACPNTVPKAHIYVDDKVTITFPLLKMKETEEDFYRFSGLVSMKNLLREERVIGVNKRLELITPTEKGHIEESIIGNEIEVARRLNVGLDIVKERVRVLTRRDKIGRTGVYIKSELSDDETFEEHLENLSDSEPALKRQMRYR
ncbi:MAG: nucleotidyltransferase domain-containing protein [Thermoplasmata archaeon]